MALARSSVVRLARVPAGPVHKVMSNSASIRTTTTHSRELSPHITIYKFGTNAIASTGHRGTGIFMTAGLFGGSILYLVAGDDPKAIVPCLREWHVLPLVKMGVAIPIVYHLSTGIRHIMWDHLKMHSLKVATEGSLYIMGGAVAVGLLLSLVEFSRNE